MHKRVSVLLMVIALFLALAWPVLADTINVTITPLDATTAFAIDTTNPPPSNLNILKGSYGEFDVTVKNITTQNLNLYVKGYNAIAVNPDETVWALEESTPTSPSGGEYGVQVRQSSSSWINVNKNGIQIGTEPVVPDGTVNLEFRIYLPVTVLPPGPHQGKIDLYGVTT